MKDSPISYYGSKTPLPHRISLRAGNLTMIYENGFLRYISQGNTEIIRMIYHAIRDHKWDTMPTRIENEQVEIYENHFSISYDSICEENGIDFTWKCRIDGNEDGQIVFEINGLARSTFRKNRAGFCLLHPPETCAGFPCRIEHPDGGFTDSHFPATISPHQPFKNISSMIWGPGGEGKATLKFEGDIFETEDQRNWTDASYKTYSTPLAIPFPAEMKQGDTVFQRISLSVENRTARLEAAEIQPTVTIMADQPPLPFPELGIGRSSVYPKLPVSDILTLRNVGFQYCHTEVRFTDPDWQQKLLTTSGEAHSMGCRLFLAVFFGNAPEEEVLMLEKVISRFISRVKTITVLSAESKTTPKKLIREVFTALRKLFPGIDIGVGTNNYFTEINREHPTMHRADFLTYSLNPQVHAFDNASMVESLFTQGTTVESARHFSDGKPIFVGPVSLKPRFNPNATGPQKPPAQGELPVRYDTRQFSLFGAGWTLGSIKYLAEAGTKKITYYETAGIYGIIAGSRISEMEKTAGLTEGQISPVYMLFRQLLSIKNSQIIQTKSNTPLKIASICVSGKGKKLLALANYSEKVQTVVIEGLTPGAQTWCMDSGNYEILHILEKLPYEDHSEPVNGNAIEMPPFGIRFLWF
ncbi:MAG: hypothetical protein R3D00_31260 [Bacteroidia bacterium]